MSDEETGTTQKIIAAAEQRMRRGGFHDFSFREIAADVGIKSASVHHHFPTKQDLGVAVAEAYTERFMAALGDPEDADRGPAELLKSYVELFRQALVRDRSMCLCGILVSELGSLPDGVANAGGEFFRRNVAWLEIVLGRKSPDMMPDMRHAEALRILAVMEGAMLVAKGLGDNNAFESIAARILD